jgi:hypothetical protein
MLAGSARIGGNHEPRSPSPPPQPPSGLCSGMLSVRPPRPTTLKVLASMATSSPRTSAISRTVDAGGEVARRFKSCQPDAGQRHFPEYRRVPLPLSSATASATAFSLSKCASSCETLRAVFLLALIQLEKRHIMEQENSAPAAPSRRCPLSSLSMPETTQPVLLIPMRARQTAVPASSLRGSGVAFQRKGIPT